MVAATLRSLWVNSGDVVGLHSNMPSLGKIMVYIQRAGGPPAVEQAADDVIDALPGAGEWICYLGTNSKTLSLLHLAEVLCGSTSINTASLTA